MNKCDIGNKNEKKSEVPAGTDEQSKEMERNNGNYFQVDGQGRLPGGDSRLAALGPEATRLPIFHYLR